MVDKGTEGISVGKDGLAEGTEKLSFWEAAERYTKSYQKYKETYLRIIDILETWCKDPKGDMIGVHVADAINLLYRLVNLNNRMWVDYMRMRSKTGTRGGKEWSST